MSHYYVAMTLTDLEVAMLYDFDRYPMSERYSDPGWSMEMWNRDQWVREIARRWYRRYVTHKKISDVGE